MLTRRKSKRPNAAEARHLDRIGRMPCLVCGARATVHHVTSDGYKRITRTHRLVAPLCPIHHQKVFDPFSSDPVSVEGLGHAGFTAKYGIDLYAWAQAEWERSSICPATLTVPANDVFSPYSGDAA